MDPINLEGWGGKGDRREFQKGGDICIPISYSSLYIHIKV